MTDIARPAPRLPVPGRSLWWIAGAGAAGLIAPSAIGVVTALVAYYPVGSILPPLFVLGSFGTLLTIVLVAISVVVVGAGYSILAWRWRPILLSLLVFMATIPGLYLTLYSHGHLRMRAFPLLVTRSAPLIEAIERYENDLGRPPQALAELVPTYLSEIPHTGMPAYPNYDYRPKSGFCRNRSAWTVEILVGEFLNWDIFFYCPHQDFPDRRDVERIGTWAYFWE